MAQVSPSQKEVRADPQLRSIVDPAWKQRTLGEDSHAQSSVEGDGSAALLPVHLVPSSAMLWPQECLAVVC